MPPNPFARGERHWSHRTLGEDESMRVIQAYEYRNRFIAPIVRRGFSWLLGWQYHGGESDRRRLVRQLPLIAFPPALHKSRLQFQLDAAREPPLIN